MKKFVSLLLAVSCVLGLTACGSKDSSSAAASNAASTAASTQEAQTEAKTTGTLQIAIPNDTTNEATVPRALHAMWRMMRFFVLHWAAARR